MEPVIVNLAGRYDMDHKITPPPSWKNDNSRIHRYEYAQWKAEKKRREKLLASLPEPPKPKTDNEIEDEKNEIKRSFIEKKMSSQIQNRPDRVEAPPSEAWLLMNEEKIKKQRNLKS